MSWPIGGVTGLCNKGGASICTPESWWSEVKCCKCTVTGFAQSELERHVSAACTNMVWDERDKSSGVSCGYDFLTSVLFCFCLLHHLIDWLIIKKKKIRGRMRDIFVNFILEQFKAWSMLLGQRWCPISYIKIISGWPSKGAMPS